MTMFLHALILGYGVAALGAVGLSDAGAPLWAVLPLGWIGANVLALGFAAAGAAIRPDKPARRASFTAREDEFRLWDDDLARDLARDLIDAEVRPAKAVTAPAAVPETGLRAAG